MSLLGTKCLYHPQNMNVQVLNFNVTVSGNQTIKEVTSVLLR